MASQHQFLPGDSTLKSAFQLAIKIDKPIYTDYWEGSCQRKNAGEVNSVFIGIQSNDNTLPKRLIMPDMSAYTSDIVKMYGSGEDIIIETDNSLYIVSKLIEKKMERR